MKAALFQALLAQARRRSRVPQDAEDLLQDALLAAARAGRTDLDDASNRRWISGVIRNLAAMAGRSEGRRKARERDRKPDPPAATEAGSTRALDALPRGVRVVALLVLHGMTREEIRQALELSDPAFRQRLAAVRRAMDGVSPEMRQEALALAYARRQSGELDLGPLRRALLAWVRVEEGIGTHDPDGHLIVISRSTSRKGPPRQR